MCDLRKSGKIPWGYWDSNSDSVDSPESFNSPENINSPESFDSPESPESVNSPESEGFAWWKNPFIPKRKRLWLDFLISNGLLHQTHEHIPHGQFMQMWRDFLGDRNVAATAPENTDGNTSSNPFIPEFKQLWLEFLKSNALMNATREHISHDHFIQMWNDFLAERGVELPRAPVAVAAVGENTGTGLTWKDNPFIPEGKKLWLEFLESSGVNDPTAEPVPEEVLMQAWKDFLAERGIEMDGPEAPTVSTFATHKEFLLWFFNHLSSGQLTTTITPSSATEKKTKGIPHDQFVAWWKQFLQEQTNPGTFASQQQTQEDFLNWFFREMHSQLEGNKGVAAVEVAEPADAWKDDPFIPKGVKLWLEFFESSGVNDPLAEPLPEGQLPIMWKHFLAEKGITLPQASVAVAAVEVEPVDAWKDNPIIPKGVKLWLEFLESSGVNDPLAEPLPEGQLPIMWKNFLAEKSITLPQASVAATSAQMYHSAFLQWWFTQLNSGQIAVATVKKSSGIPHQQFVAWWKQFLQDQANPSLFATEKGTQEDFMNWWLTEMQDRFTLVGTSDAKTQHIPHDQFLDIMCDNLMTGTYDPEFPDADKNAAVPAPDAMPAAAAVHQVENVDANSIDTAIRAAERVLRSVPLIDG